MAVNPVIRVRINDNKLTATEINPYAGKDGRKLNINQFNGIGGVINGELLTMNDYHQKYEVANNMLKEFVIRKINIQNGEQDIPDKYSREQYGECINVGKVYEARVLDEGGIILI